MEKYLNINYAHKVLLKKKLLTVGTLVSSNLSQDDEISELISE